MKMTLAEAALGLGAVLETPSSLANAGSLQVAGYTANASTVAPGDLFFSLERDVASERKLLLEAIERGAVAVVVARSTLAALPDAAFAVPLLIAENPASALRLLAANVRRRWGKKLIAVTGSSGKSMTREAIIAALRTQFRVARCGNDASDPSELYLQLLSLEAEDDFAVVEMGMSRSGEIASLCRTVSPDWGVVTGVGIAHIENFADGQRGIARAKYELIESLPSSGVAFLNCSDAYVSQFGRSFEGKSVYYGEGLCANPVLLGTKETLQGLTLEYRSGSHHGEIHLPLLGVHHAASIIAGVAVAVEAGIDVALAAHALETADWGKRSAKVVEFRGATLILDCSSTAQDALSAMIGTLAAHPAQRRLLIAGELPDLGDKSAEVHAACGQLAVDSGLDLVAVVGGNAVHLAMAACAGGVAALFLPDADAALRWLQPRLREGDAVLIKGDASTHLERIAEQLL